MKYYLSLLIIIISTASLFGQYRPEDAYDEMKFRQYYGDQLENNEKYLYAWYHFTQSVTENGIFVFRSFYPETKQMVEKASYKTDEFIVLNGPYERYEEDGTLTRKGQYIDGSKEGEWFVNGLIGQYEKNNKIGEWNSYYPNGELKVTCHFLNDKRDGEYIKRDSLGNILQRGDYHQGSKNGSWKTFYETGVLKTVAQYQNGNKEGLAQLFNEDGTIKQETVYKSGTLVSGKTFSLSVGTIKITDTFRRVEKMPYLKSCEGVKNPESCSKKKLINHVYGALKYPEKSKKYGLQGKAIISFVINQEGDIEGLKCIRCLSDEIKEETFRVIKSLPKFNPGMQGGKKVKVRYTLPLKFKLQ